MKYETWGIFDYPRPNSTWFKEKVLAHLRELRHASQARAYFQSELLAATREEWSEHQDEAFYEMERWIAKKVYDALLFGNPPG